MLVALDLSLFTPLLLLHFLFSFIFFQDFNFNWLYLANRHHHLPRIPAAKLSTAMIAVAAAVITTTEKTLQQQSHQSHVRTSCVTPFLCLLLSVHITGCAFCNTRLKSCFNGCVRSYVLISVRVETKGKLWCSFGHMAVNINTLKYAAAFLIMYMDHVAVPVC